MRGCAKRVAKILKIFVRNASSRFCIFDWKIFTIQLFSLEGKASETFKEGFDNYN